MEQLAQNNNKSWFDTHKNEYLAAKDDYEALVTEVLAGMATLDPAFKDVDPKKSIMRIYRDVRFSKDKSPYKTNLGAGFGMGGGKNTGAGYYLHIEPGKSFAGGGLWQPEGPALKAIRQEIDYNFEEFGKIVNDKKFKKMFAQIDGDKLVKAPQGYSDDNPAIEYLRLKSFTVGAPLPDADLTKKGAAKKIVDAFATMKPFVDFLNKGVV
ncbi:DUF2461 domain-containing protein [Nemorincola caseinilytica]|uniref:DUF2461 domain-containing protein n=2 Tax=Nemorincola caseinilytica TaxID=2054315 RepID=A0ABP8N4Z1_9BACT